MTEYTVTRQAEMDNIPKPLNVGDIIWFKYSGSVIKVPVNLGVNKIRIDCFGGDSDLGEASDIASQNTGIKRLHGNISGTRRRIGRGGHATGILDMTTLPSSVQYLYVVVGGGGKKDGTLNTYWSKFIFGGGGTCNCAVPSHIMYESSDQYDSSTSKYSNTDKDPAKSFTAGGASDVRLYYDINANDFQQLSGEPSDLRAERAHLVNDYIDKGTLAVKSLKSRIIVAGGAGAQATPACLGEEGPGTSGGFANKEGISISDEFFSNTAVVGYNGFPVGTIVPGGGQRQTNYEYTTSTEGSNSPIIPYAVGIFGIGGTGSYYHNSNYSSGAGGGGWFGGYASNYGGTGGSSYVSGSSFHNPHDPSISFDEQLGVTLDDSYAATINTPEEWHDKAAAKTDGYPRDGLVRFEVVEGSSVAGSIYLRGTSKSKDYGAQLFSQEQVNSYKVNDSQGETFIKITEHNGVPYFARVSTEKTAKAVTYSNTISTRSVTRGTGTASKENAAFFFLSAFKDTSIPEVIQKITISGSLSFNISATTSWKNASIASAGGETPRHALSLCMISYPTNGSDIYGNNANHRKLFSGDKAPVPDSFVNQSSQTIQLGSLKRIYEGLYTTPTSGTRLTALNDQITVSKTGIKQTTPKSITITVNIEVPRSIFSSQYILLVAVLGWKENDEYAEVTFNPSTLQVSGSSSTLAATPFVYKHNNTNYYILPK